MQYLEVQYFHPCLNTTYAELFTYMEAQDQPFNIIVSEGYGGVVDTLNGLLSMIERSSKPTMTIVPSVAMSCNLGLAVSGTKGLRIVAPRASLLLHQVSSGVIGKASDIENEAMEIQRLNQTLAYDLYDKAGGHESGFTKNLLKDDCNNIYQDYKDMLNKVELSQELNPHIISPIQE